LIDSLGRHRVERATFENRVAWSKVLWVRGDRRGRLAADQDRAERVATEAVAWSAGAGSALYPRARGVVAERGGPTTNPLAPAGQGHRPSVLALHR
jgi:hypothetical protein